MLAHVRYFSWQKHWPVGIAKNKHLEVEEKKHVHFLCLGCEHCLQVNCDIIWQYLERNISDYRSGHPYCGLPSIISVKSVNMGRIGLAIYPVWKRHL